MNPQRMPAFDSESGALNIIVDTPKGSRNKFSWNEEWELFEMTGVLPAGAVFPTISVSFQKPAADGDPLDVLIMTDEPTFAGCLVQTRLIGVIEAEQTEAGKTMRNDRLIGVAINAVTDRDLKRLGDLNEKLVDQIEHFFVSYN